MSMPAGLARGQHGWGRAESARLSRRIGLYVDHPTDSEAVGEHAETGRPERLPQRHLHLATVGQRGKQPVGLGFRRHRERQGKAAEALAFSASVGRHQRAVGDAKLAVHHLVFEARLQHAGRRRFGAVLVQHQHAHFGAESGAVESQRLFAAAAEEEMGWTSVFGIDFPRASVIGR